MSLIANRDIRFLIDSSVSSSEMLGRLSSSPAYSEIIDLTMHAQDQFMAAPDWQMPENQSRQTLSTQEARDVVVSLEPQLFSLLNQKFVTRPRVYSSRDGHMQYLLECREALLGSCRMNAELDFDSTIQGLTARELEIYSFLASSCCFFSEGVAGEYKFFTDSEISILVLTSGYTRLLTEMNAIHEMTHHAQFESEILSRASLPFFEGLAVATVHKWIEAFRPNDVNANRFMLQDRFVKLAKICFALSHRNGKPLPQSLSKLAEQTGVSRDESVQTISPHALGYAWIYRLMQNHGDNVLRAI